MCCVRKGSFRSCDVVMVLGFRFDLVIHVTHYDDPVQCTSLVTQYFELVWQLVKGEMVSRSINTPS